MYVKRIVAAGIGIGTLATALAILGGASFTTVATAGHVHARRPLALSNSRPDDASPVVYQWGQYGGGHGSDGGSPTGAGPVRRRPEAVNGIHGTVVQVATSNSDDYALTSAGVVYAWGAGSNGELGNGSKPTVSDSAVKVDFPAGVKIAQLADPMPYDGGMAISSSGIVYAWGNDMHQQFCQPQPGDLTRPVKVPLTDVTLADGALRHAIYYTHGQVVSCGTGPDGQLGNGTSGSDTQTGTPVAVQGLPQGRVVALESSWGDAGVLMADGDYYDWGYNAAGQVGNGTGVETTTAAQVSLPEPVKQIFQGGSFSNNGQTITVLHGGGGIWEWGNGRFGQMGNDTVASELSPMRFTGLDGHTIISVASGGLTNYAIAKNGQLWSWGDNRLGELGSGSHSRKVEHPVRVPLIVSQVSSTAHNTVALGVVDTLVASR